MTRRFHITDVEAKITVHHSKGRKCKVALHHRHVNVKLSIPQLVRQEIAEGCMKGSDWGIWVGGAAEEGSHAFDRG
jgi:hypothetical protein